MSNAKYRQFEEPAKPEPVPTTEQLLEHAKRLLGMAVVNAEKSLQAADGKYTPRDCQMIVRQILDVARLERRALERTDRLERAAAKSVPAPSPAPAAARPTPPTDPASVQFHRALEPEPLKVQRAAG